MADQRLRPTSYIWSLCRHHPSLLVQSTVLLLLMAVVNLPLPLLNKLAIDHAMPSGQSLPMVALGILAFAVRAVASGFQVFQNFIVWRLMTGIGYRLRHRMVAACLGAPYQRYVDGEMGGYVGRLTADVTSIEHIVYDTFRFILRPLAMILVMVLVMGLISWPVTVIILVVTPLSVALTRRLAHDLRDRQEAILTSRQDLQSQVTEIIDNLRVIRAYAREDRYRDRVGEQVATYTDRSVAHATRRQMTQSLIDLLGLLPWLLLVAIGAWLVRDGEITIGDFMLFIIFEQLLRSPVGQLTYYIQHITGEMAAPERVQAVIDLPREIPAEAIVGEADKADAEAATARAAGQGCAIAIDAIRFGYHPSRPVLADFSLQIPAGERLAIVGPSGGGKSTLFSLLCGFYQPQVGSIRYDGQELTPAELPAIRRRLGVVFQHNPFFDGSIRSNLALDRHDNDERLWWALAQADCRDFVAGLPEGLDTAIGIRGLKLSGGQRQRLAIARALLRDPAVVLLDEATASLDSLSETQIQRALDQLLIGRTSLTIAHRLSTVVGADRIAYLADGRILEIGSHAELIARDGPYRALFETQTAGLLPRGGP